MGVFENFTLLFLILTQKHLSRQRLRAVHTEGWMGCDFCRTSYNLVIKLWVREHLGSHSICKKQFIGGILQLKTCLINFNTEPVRSLDKQSSIFRWFPKYKYSHWGLPVGAFRLVQQLNSLLQAECRHYIIGQCCQFLSLLYFGRKAQEAPISW